MVHCFVKSEASTTNELSGISIHEVSCTVADSILSEV